MTYDEILQEEPFLLSKDEKQRFLTKELLRLTCHHQEQSEVYRHMLDAIEFSVEAVSGIEDIPFLPVRLFKELELKSISKENVFKVLTSSGTSGQRVSKIYLDRATAANQQKTLVRIVKDFTGSARLPMLIIDCPSVVKDRAMFSARGAGILGFSIFGRKKLYALNDKMELCIDAVEEFLVEHKDERILLFGFTFMIWKHFYKALIERKKEIDLSKAILIHGGGWKKLIQEAVSPTEFNRSLKDVCGIERVANYYGMVEQTGGLYMECECGHLHASTYSDVIIRRGADFSVAAQGEQGIIQVVSLLPESYPGHSLLTEDEGIMLGEDDCPCGRKGKYFKVLGRLKEAEIRGCSDTYAANIKH